MSNIWRPELQPPLATDDAIQTVMDNVMSEGVFAVTNAVYARLQSEDEPFGEYLDRFGYGLNQVSAEGLWPERILKMGAALAKVAYVKSGYYQVIDSDVFDSGTFLAELWGVPDAYQTSFIEDPGLQKLIRMVLEKAPDLQNEDRGYEQIIEIGAGSTRHYLQPAVLAA